MPSPFISVIIPTYHRNDLLRKCLLCLDPSHQLYPAAKYEVIVSDDGSKTTAQQMMAEEFPWAKWVAGPRRGPAANRNCGSNQARGEWLAFTDDDCLPKAEWLSAFMASIENNISVYEGKTICEAGIKSALETSPINEEGGLLWSCNMLLSKAVFKQIQGFDENFPDPYMEDVDLRERLKKASQKSKWVPTAIIDHPPRKLPWGYGASKPLESEVLFWYKMGNRKPIGATLLRRTIINRIRYIESHPQIWGIVSSIISLFFELVWLTCHVATWDRKYRDIYIINSD